MSPRVEVRQQGEAMVATLEAGADIDISHAAELGDVLLAAVPNHAAGLVLDLESVQYLDSAGVRMLFGLARHLATRRQAIALALPHDSPLASLIRITKLESAALVGESVDDCVARVTRERAE